MLEDENIERMHGSLGNRIHPLARKLEAYLEQLLCNIRLFLLQILPFLLIKHPCYTILLCDRRGSPLRCREERQLPTCCASNNKFCVFALWVIVHGLQQTALEQVEPISEFLGVVYNGSGGILLPREKWNNPIPEVFRFVGYGRESLQDKLERLPVFLPSNSWCWVLFTERRCSNLMKVLPAR